jgi:hypothetical protein
MLLRPELYRRLVDKFQHVTIANEGEEMISRLVKDAHTNESRLDIDHFGEQYRVNCPFCNEIRQRLYISYLWGYFDDRNQSLNLWLCKCYNQECVKYYERQLWLYRSVFADVGDGNEDIILPGTRPSSASAEPFWPGLIDRLDKLSEHHPAITYLRERGFDTGQLSRFLKIGYCYEASQDCYTAGNRIIIPVFKDSQLVGWQARYVGTPKYDSTPKYYTMPRFKKSQFLYNYDRARQFPYVILTEGVTDVWRVGPASVALFGKTLSYGQKLLIGSTWGSGVAIVLLDADAQSDAEGIYDSLKDVVPKRVLVKLPEGKDPGEMTRAEIYQRIQEAAREQHLELPKSKPTSPVSPPPAVAGG